MTSISNPISGTQNTLLPGSTFNGVFLVSGGEQATETANAAVSLNANLNGVTAATGTGELALEFAQAIQGATQVDPSTGNREIIAGAGAQLTTTINNLLVQNGFSAEQASTLSANLTTQLAKSGSLTLSAAYDNNSQTSQVSISSYTAGGISLASSVGATDQSGSISIGINLDTGELNVALQEQTSSTYQAYGNLTTTSAPANVAGDLLASTVGALTSESEAADSSGSDFGQALSGSNPSNSGSGGASSGAASASGNSPLSETETDTFALTALSAVAGVLTLPSDGATGSQGASPNTPADSSTSTPQAGASTAPSSSNDSSDAGLQSLISSLNEVRVASQQEVTSLLQSLAKIAAQAQAAANAAEHKAATAGNTNNGASNAATAIGIHAGPTNDFEIQFGFTQTTSIQLLDLNGYGSTLYKRPDGSLGQITTQPVHESA
ncbi:hypothetical protein [Burkholderia sp. L27(2015)]|uniref:hypothetical protein n=1 Tax=Burkholderia sp. L27(2015) TaxID=1641858 RepID=UPI00131A6F90|nr:hypothetical protein [Burkholderia sp. L27(2015)]